MPIQPGNFCWFECATRDREKAREFYTQLFGWTAEDSPMPGDDGGVYVLFRIDGEDIAGLYEMEGPMFEGVSPHWMTYVAVDSAAESAARAKQLGGELLMDAMDVPGVGKMAFLKDPTGAMISVFEFGEHAGMSDKSNLGWSELHTPDAARAKAFYSELFGWNPKEDPKDQYTEWQVGGRSIGGMTEIPAERRQFVPPNWLPYAMIPDCAASLARATKLGATVIMPPTPIEKVGTFAILEDPTGAKLAIIQLDEAAH